MKPRTKFPGMDKLPGPVRELAEMAFPQEPDISAAVPGTTVAGQGAKVGYRAASEKFRPIIEELKNILRPTPVGPEDVVQAFKQEKYTPFRIPPRGSIKVPEFAENQLSLQLPMGQHMLQRAPKLVGRQKLQGRYYNSQPDLLPEKLGPGRPFPSSKGSRALKKEINNGIATPGVKALEDLFSEATKAPSQSIPSSVVKPKISRDGGTTGSQAAQAKGAKITQDMVRDIRQKAGMGTPIDELVKAYPTLKAQSIQDVIKRRSWNWVK